MAEADETLPRMESLASGEGSAPGRATDPVVPADVGRESFEPRRTIACPTCGRHNPLDARFCLGCGFRFAPLDAGEQAAHAMADPLIGRIVADRYRIKEMIGRGGMGVVYRVEHVRIGKLMAMKLLHGQLAEDREVMKRFRREAEAVSKLDHPNTVQVFDFGRSEGMTYLVMELLSGRDLGAIIQAEEALPFARAARIALQIASSVQQAHEHGIVHRDLKPENVRILADRAEPDFVKVLDFGLAKLRENEEAANASITRQGFIVGTPYYMAPEHIRGESVDERSDVYALGALVYKAVAGVPPFWAPSPVGVLTKHLTEPLVPPSERSGRDVPAACDEIIARAMHKDPKKRYQSMAELRAELASYLRSVGGDTQSVKVKLDPAYEVPTDSGRRVAIATRGDVDAYERGIRRTTWISTALLVLLVIGGIAGGIWAWRHRPVAAVTTEHEPNDAPEQANVLTEGEPLRGMLGQRLDETHGDVDVYAIEGRGARTVARIETSGLPNMDVVLEVYRVGRAEPILVTDAAGEGQPERIANLPLDGSRHLVRVRERAEPGRYPTENVSDTYSVQWSSITPGEHDEVEVNDRMELATDLREGAAGRGFVGWNGDRDVWCIADDVRGATLELSAVASLDLVLTVVERGTDRTHAIDEGRVGAGERAELGDVSRGRTCAIVAAAPGSSVRADADEAYVLRVRAATGATSEGTAP